MKVFSGLAQGAALIVLATPGLAQITADDVWANQRAYLDALGLQVTATEAREGQTLTLSGVEMNYPLPMGFGTLFVRTGDITLTEQPDGTVAFSYPAESVITIGGNFDIDGDAGAISADLTLRLTDYSDIASGVPGDITYATTIGMADFALGTVSLTPDPGIGPYDLTAFLTMQGITSTTRITVSDMIRVSVDTASGATVYDIQYSDDMGTAFSTTGGATGGTSNGQVALPTTPLDPLNLAIALRNGLSITATSLTTDTVSKTIVESFGSVVSDQRQQVISTTQTLSLDQSGIVIDGAAEGMTMELRQDYSLPFPVTIAVSSVAANLRMPVSASTELQPIAFGLNMRGLSVNDEVWSMADAGGVLPRDPGTLAFSLTGEVMNSIELFDFMSLAALEDQFENGPMPIQLHSLNLSGFEAAAIGVTASGEAAFTFDNTDTTTYDGLPRPVGTGSIVINGANALMDRLVQSGLISSDDVMGARMGIAMFAEATGDDQLTATGEMTADGQIIVNGQRIQ